MEKKRSVTNERTVVQFIPRMLASVKDVYPPASRSAKYQLVGQTRGRTRVREGEVYVQEGGVMKRYRAGQSFTEKPGVARIIGSVYGAKTSTVYKIAVEGNVYSVVIDEE
jgi:hypothetical protein